MTKPKGRQYDYVAATPAEIAAIREFKRRFETVRDSGKMDWTLCQDMIKFRDGHGLAMGDDLLSHMIRTMSRIERTFKKQRF